MSPWWEKNSWCPWNQPLWGLLPGLTPHLLGVSSKQRPCLLRRNTFFSLTTSWSWITPHHAALVYSLPVVRNYPWYAVGIHSLWESSSKMELYPMLDLQDSTQMWEDVSVSKCIFHRVTNAQYSLHWAKQEGSDTISKQPCMAAYLSFVTIFNTVHRRKTHFQNPILSY